MLKKKKKLTIKGCLSLAQVPSKVLEIIIHTSTLVFSKAAPKRGSDSATVTRKGLGRLLWFLLAGVKSIDGVQEDGSQATGEGHFPLPVLRVNRGF